MPGLLDLLSQTWPARLAQDAWSGITLPRDVYQGKVDPLSADAIGRATNLAMLTMLGATGAPAGALGSGPVLPAGSGLSKLSMDEASRMARAKSTNYADEPFYRGEATGKLPNQYETGGHFSREQEVARGFAQRGGQAEPREFRLNLSKTFKDYEDLTAAQYAKLVAASEPKLATGLVDMIAPGQNAEWFAEFAKRNPDMKVTDGTSGLIRLAIENSTDPVGVFRRAGYDALDSGRDVRKISGFGIRLKDAAFNPARAHERDITAAITGGSLAVPLMRYLDPNQD